ncbi:hypothetical protein K435DRAFT_794426 [Dendrothele bispora CBS 962.96]|uniref:Cation-transporting P-type ATPase N-terminal domain-containing protein n=1 Tax=Dendrothele bispora (strain CBS 962.96) TaxID=1314807 RepID=A0A4S8MCA9_DENBC|nr:hypothetical protein K435DRAFT_794426 [Dendrothele bispora CBS 962.96]
MTWMLLWFNIHGLLSFGTTCYLLLAPFIWSLILIPLPMDKKECRTEPILAFVLESIQRSSDLRLFKRKNSGRAHTQSTSQSALTSQNSQTALAEHDAKPRLFYRYGENLLSDKGGVSAVFVLVRQMANALTLVLVAAMALSKTGSKEPYKAEKIMDSLRSLSSPTARVTFQEEDLQFQSGLISQNPQTALAERAHLLNGSVIHPKLRINADGQDDAKVQLEEYGENLLPDKSGASTVSLCIRQMANDWIKEPSSPLSLSSVGFLQEYEAEKTLDSIRIFFSYCCCGIEWCSDFYKYRCPMRLLIQDEIKSQVISFWGDYGCESSEIGLT